jgi:hypothetical protein
MCAALFGLMAVCSTMVLPRSMTGAATVPLIEEHVEVAVGRGGHPEDAVDRADRLGQLLGDDARRLAQRAGQFEGHWRADVAEGPRRRNFERDRGGIGRHVERGGERGADRGPEPLVQGQHHDG